MSMVYGSGACEGYVQPKLLSRRDLAGYMASQNCTLLDESSRAFWSNNYFSGWGVSGYHSALKRWLTESQADLLTIVSRMSHWCRQPLFNHKASISDSEERLQKRMRINCFARVVCIIHTYTLNLCLKTADLRFFLHSCTGKYTKTMGMPCIHKIHQIAARGGTLTPSDFHAHW